MRWECVDLPWELPDYISDLARVLKHMQASVASGGIVEQAVVAIPLTLPPPRDLSDGESKVGVSELPSPHKLVPKVRQADNVEHPLDKGLWVGTGAMRRGWEIYVNINFPFLFTLATANPSGSGPVDGARPDVSAVSSPTT